MRGGREVVVKVQRPNIRASLAEDLEFFHELAEFMSDHTGAGSRIDVWRWATIRAIRWRPP